MPSPGPYWFPAKRRGWGWGPPTAWQGWLVLAVFALLVIAGAVLLLPRQGAGVFIGFTLLLCLVLVAVCWVKGESPTGHGRRPK
jgi:hypothetical protein